MFFLNYFLSFSSVPLAVFSADEGGGGEDSADVHTHFLIASLHPKYKQFGRNMLMGKSLLCQMAVRLSDWKFANHNFYFYGLFSLIFSNDKFVNPSNFLHTPLKAID